MATVKTVSVTYDRKINLGDFNSATVGITLWADIDEDDDMAQVMSGLWQMATNNVRAKAQTFQRNVEAQAEEIYLGLPVELRTVADKEDNNAH
jgi:hypothetical protein